MGRKRLTLEERAARARRGGFDEDLTSIDASNVLTPIVPCTVKLYARNWKAWQECVPLPSPRSFLER